MYTYINTRVGTRKGKRKVGATSPLHDALYTTRLRRPVITTRCATNGSCAHNAGVRIRPRTYTLNWCEESELIVALEPVTAT